MGAEVMDLKPGMVGEAEMVVGTRDGAHRVGSGKIAVLATPVMIGLIEEAALEAVEAALPAGMQSLGTHLDVSHIAATPIGMKVTARAELLEVDRRQLVFRVEARDEKELIGEGRHTRVVVTEDRFVKRVGEKAGG